jgi:hypothetical protein
MLRNLLLCASVVLFSVAAGAEVTVSKEIAFSKPENVREAIRDQCNLTTIVPDAIASNSDAKLVDGKGSLSLVISDVHAPGGWIFSGPKWVEVKGSMKQGGETLSFRAKRYSAFNPFVGNDIATWLASPTDGATLGDAKNRAD